MNGTSMATPIVTGILALWLQANPKLTESEALQILRKTASKKHLANDLADNNYGYGVVDALAGIHEVLNMTSSITPVDYGIAIEGNVLNVPGANSVTLYRPDGSVIACARGNSLLIPEKYRGMFIVKYTTWYSSFVKKIFKY